MAEARGSGSPEGVTKVNGAGGYGPRLARICISTLALMTLYEGAKKASSFRKFLSSASHIVTIFLTSLVATASSVPCAAKDCAVARTPTDGL